MYVCLMDIKEERDGAWDRDHNHNDDDVGKPEVIA